MPPTPGSGGRRTHRPPPRFAAAGVAGGAAMLHATRATLTRPPTRLPRALPLLCALVFLDSPGGALGGVEPACDSGVSVSLNTFSVAHGHWISPGPLGTEADGVFCAAAEADEVALQATGLCRTGGTPHETLPCGIRMYEGDGDNDGTRWQRMDKCAAACLVQRPPSPQVENTFGSWAERGPAVGYSILYGANGFKATGRCYCNHGKPKPNSCTRTPGPMQASTQPVYESFDFPEGEVPHML